jgi:group II intron reverse transcriptase/maturase
LGYFSKSKLEQPSNWDEVRRNYKVITCNETHGWEAYKQVRRNGGSAGVDQERIEDFDANLSKNLYKIWNRMASGSYFPPAVRTVLIPKKQGGNRALGIPTINDRIAQAVVKQYVEPKLDKLFHNNSYGYRLNKSAHQAVKQCEEHCRQYAWVIDVDIKGFFDNIDHTIIMELLAKHMQEKWVLMYISRWLKAPVEQLDGLLIKRCKGTPQGGVISPLLANLYLHHAFDGWMREECCSHRFERYADDIIIHCRTREEAEQLLVLVKRRLERYKLELHPSKTKIVYCKDYRRQDRHENRSFTFLGFSLQPRTMLSKRGGRFLVFRAAISQEAKSNIRRMIGGVIQSNRYKHSIAWMAEKLNAKLRGWINYYAVFMKWETLDVFSYLNGLLVRWIRNVYKISGKWNAFRKLKEIQRQEPYLFYHWQFGIRS